MTYFTSDSNAVLPTTSEKRIAVAAQKRIQVGELSALALEAHPHPLLRIPSSRAMEQEERALSVAVGRFRPLRHLRAPLDASAYLSFRSSMLLRASSNSAASCRQHFLVRVRKVGQQAEMQIAVPIGEEANFERLDQIVDVSGAGEHGRDHHQRVCDAAEFPRKNPSAAVDAASRSSAPSS